MVRCLQNLVVGIVGVRNHGHGHRPGNTPLPGVAVEPRVALPMSRAAVLAVNQALLRRREQLGNSPVWRVDHQRLAVEPLARSIQPAPVPRVASITASCASCPRSFSASVLRSSGVLVELFQTPCKSGCPHGVLGASCCQRGPVARQCLSLPQRQIAAPPGSQQA